MEENKVLGVFEADLNTNKCFLSLPDFVKSAISHSGVKVTCEDDLLKIYENLTREG